MYDVIHFKLLIDVDARHVNEVIQQFSKGRLISIYRQDLYSLDTTHEASQSGGGYLYGDARVIRLALQGEILFLRSWTTPWMPERIKQGLGLIAPAPGTAGMPGGGLPGGGMPGGGMPGVGMPGMNAPEFSTTKAIKLFSPCSHFWGHDNG